MSVLSHWNFGLNRSNTISLKCYCTVVREKPESQPEGHWLLCGTFIHELVVDCRLVWMSPGEARLQRLQRLELERGHRPRPHLQSWHWSSPPPPSPRNWISWMITNECKMGEQIFWYHPAAFWKLLRCFQCFHRSLLGILFQFQTGR